MRGNGGGGSGRAGGRGSMKDKDVIEHDKLVHSTITPSEGIFFLLLFFNYNIFYKILFYST